MLQSYLNDWANARKNAVILEEQKDENDNLMFQRAEIVFQGVKIEIRNSRIVINNTPTPDDKFSAEFFIPSTITLIDAFRNSEYPSTEFIATMLEAIDPNFEAERKEVVAKRRATMDQFLSEKKQEWMSNFEHTKYELPEVNFMVDFAISRMRWERIDNLSLFTQLMAKYQDNILDDTVVRTTFDGKEITAQDILFDLVCRSCNKRQLAEDNKFVVSGKGADFVFLDDTRDERLPDFVVNAKNVLRSIYADCNNAPSIFTTVAHGIASYYSFHFNESIAYRLAKASERRPSKARRNNTVTVGAMMTNIADVFENARPLKKKGKKE